MWFLPSIRMHSCECVCVCVPFGENRIDFQPRKPTNEIVKDFENARTVGKKCILLLPQAFALNTTITVHPIADL